jgi:hypothetical protein
LAHWKHTTSGGTSAILPHKELLQGAPLPRHVKQEILNIRHRLSLAVKVKNSGHVCNV